MDYTQNQLKFARYLCMTLGMEDYKFIDTFLNCYAKIYGGFRQSQSGKWHYDTSNAISALILERDIKKFRGHLKFKKRKFNYLRATDLANFTFCPASFAIANTFEIEHPTGVENREIGNDFHDSLRLISKSRKYNTIDDNDAYHNSILYDIKQSEIIYVGHGDDRKTFINEEYKIACEPDYIFRDKNSNFFVAEEKFHYKREPNKLTFDEAWLDSNYYGIDTERINRRVNEWDNYMPIFHLNHQIQLITYLKSIREYDLKYGYLIYWYYDYDGGNDNTPYIHKVHLKKISINENAEVLFNKVISGIRGLLDTGSQHFLTDKVNANKCASCVVNKYCGHKSKRYRDITIPYLQDYLKIYHAKYE